MLKRWNKQGHKFQFTHPVWDATYVPYRLLIPNYEFQFTHPVWGATISLTRTLCKLSVSIHAPRVGCDDKKSAIIRANNKFQFTHPVWGATGLVSPLEVAKPFQFTHPVWGATGDCPQKS